MQQDSPSFDPRTLFRLDDRTALVIGGGSGIGEAAALGLAAHGAAVAVADLAHSKLVPIYVVGLGSEDPARDLHLYDLMVDEVAFVDDPITFSAKLKGYGFAGKTAAVTLRESSSNEVLASEQVRRILFR